jgi:hypothetical protein
MRDSVRLLYLKFLSGTEWILDVNNPSIVVCLIGWWGERENIGKRPSFEG